MILQQYRKQWRVFYKMLAIIHQPQGLDGIHESKLQGDHACSEFDLRDGSAGCLDIKFAVRIPIRQPSGSTVKG